MPVSIDAEEGELSEGQFEDLYESDQPISDQVLPRRAALSTATGAHLAKRADNLEADFYDDEEEGEISPTAANPTGVWT